MNKTTVALSREVLSDILKEKKKLKTKTIDETIKKILSEYKELRRRAALIEIATKNREERKIDLKEFLEDRKIWGKVRRFY